MNSVDIDVCWWWYRVHEQMIVDFFCFFLLVWVKVLVGYNIQYTWLSTNDLYRLRWRTNLHRYYYCHQLFGHHVFTHTFKVSRQSSTTHNKSWLQSCAIEELILKPCELSEGEWEWSLWVCIHSHMANLIGLHRLGCSHHHHNHKYIVSIYIYENGRSEWWSEEWGSLLCR